MTTLPTILQKAIANRAEKLANFTLKYKLLGNVEAINRLHAWCENFAPFLDGLEILVPVIENIRLISDMEIADRVMHAIEEEFAADESSVFLCPLGGENESSARIINNLNDHHGYSGNIEDCLTKIQKRQVKQPVIVFIDDFLNSGGQFSSILETWMTNSSLKPDFRKHLSAEHRELLRQCRIRFYFYLGMHPGRTKAETAIKKHNLNAKTVVFQQYDDKRGIFGNQASFAEIRAGLDKPASDSSIFKGFTCRQIQPFLELCEQVGNAYLKRIKPEWPPEKTASRLLGYGNSAQLFITANNVPTSTLTCLWAEGSMQIRGKNICWQPLLPRREKMAGSESVATMTKQDGVASPYSLPLLDDTDGKDSALEVMLFTHLAHTNRDNLQTILMNDESHLFLNAFLPTIRNHMNSDKELK